MKAIPISSLNQTHLEAQRHHRDESRVQYFLKNQTEIGGVIVYENPDNGERLLVNGHHRVEAARRLGWTHIMANVEPGNRVAASMYQDFGDRKPWPDVETKNKTLEAGDQ